MAYNIDANSRSTLKAQKAMVQSIEELISGDEKGAAKKVLEYGTKVFDSDDFGGLNEENNKALKGVAATTSTGKLSTSKHQGALKSLIRVQDILEQDGNVDAGDKVAELSKKLFSSEDYGKARKEHLALPDKNRND